MKLGDDPHGQKLKLGALKAQSSEYPLFSIMKAGGPTDGVFQLSSTPGPVVTFPEEGEVEATVVIEDGEEEQADFLKLDGQENGDLQASLHSFWWTIRRGTTEIYRLNNTGSYKFNVTPANQFSFSLDGNRGSKRAVLSYFFTPKRNSFSPGDGGSAAATVSNVSSTITSGMRVLSVDVQANLTGATGNPRWLDYKWQYAESGSNTWVDLPIASGFEYTGERSKTLYLNRNYLVNNFARRYRSVISSSYYMIDPVISQEIPGLSGPIVELPGKPAIVSVEPDNSLVNLSWSAAFNGFSTITDYVVEYQEYHGFMPMPWITFTKAASSATSVTVTGLTNGKGYAFRVSAVNSAGQGQPSTRSNLSFGYVTPGIIPEPPVLLTATPGVGLVSLDWEPAPSYSGSSYVVDISSNNGASWGQVSSGNTADWPQGATNATFRNLTGGTEYSFRVRAFGTSSKPSDPSNMIKATPTVAVPYPPVNLKVHAYYSDQKENLGLNWEDDPRYPGAPKTGQVAQYSLDGGVTWIPIASNNQNGPHYVNLSNSPSVIPSNTQFLFRAATINSVGQSEWSEPKAGTTMAGAVPTLVAYRGQSSVNLNWSAPSGGNSTIVDYVVGIRPGAQVGYDLWSVDSGTRIQNNTNSPTAINITRLTATSAVVNNLTPGKLYFFDIKAVNSGRTTNSPDSIGALTGLGRPMNYASPSTTPYASTIPSAPVSAPTALAGTPGVVYTMGSNEDANSVSLSWTAPTNNGGLEITGYAIQYSANNGSTWSNSNDYLDPDYCLACPQSREQRPLSPPALTTAKVKNLTLMQPHVFRVAAINEIGTGPYSAASAPVTPTKVPLGPEGFAATAGNGSVALSWTARTVDSERLPVIGYNMWYRTSDYWSNVINNTGIYNPPGPWLKFNGNTLITGTSTVVTGLTNGKSYNFRVHAVNAGGEGGTSTMLTLTPTGSSSSSLGPRSAPH